MEKKGSALILVGIVAMVAVVGLVIVWSEVNGGLSAVGQATSSCRDSDGGAYPNVAGGVEPLGSTTVTVDMCQDATHVYEKQCGTRGNLDSVDLSCAYGYKCVPGRASIFGKTYFNVGRCAPCRDSDDGAYPNVAGGVEVFSSGTVTVDTCPDATHVIERQCGSTGLNSVELSCASGYKCFSTTASILGKFYPNVGRCAPPCVDNDRDGYQVNSPSACIRTTALDCNDANWGIKPGATEFCDDGIDQDCNGSDLSCPVETRCDNVDNNGNGLLDEGCDDDGDNFCDSGIIISGTPSTCTAGGNDCNDGDVAIKPDAREICDNVDNNCNSAIDEGCDDDNDNYCDWSMLTIGAPLPATCTAGAADCNDVNATIRPGATEACGNGIDEDCSGSDLAC